MHVEYLDLAGQAFDFEESPVEYKRCCQGHISHTPGPEEAADLLLRSIDVKNAAPNRFDNVFYHYFWNQIASVEQEEMCSKEERKKMIHIGNVEQFIDYCQKYVVHNKHKMDFELARKIQKGEIRGHWAQEMLHLLKEEAMCPEKGLSYVGELCDGEQSPVQNYLTDQMKKANYAYLQLEEEKHRLKMECEQILDHCQHNIFYRLTQGKRQLVEVMEKVCEVELEIYRFQWLEKLLRECIQCLIHDISPQVKQWNYSLFCEENFYRKKREDFPIPFDTGMKSIVQRLLADEPMVRLMKKMSEILVNTKNVNWENFFKGELLVHCPYEELEKNLEGGKEEGYLIPPDVRNRQIRTHVHTDMESVMKEHYPYCNS